MYRADLQWALHMRTDSSPQFSRDYLVCEVDLVDLESVYSLSPAATLQSLTWTTRLLPLQVLGRQSTSLPFKYRSLLRMLHLECGDVSLAKARTCSMLGDMGVEARLATVPDYMHSGVESRAFQNGLPLHDIDHSLHHTMEELKSCFPSEVFELFDKQLNTLAKYFSKADNLARFRQLFILNNEQIQGYERKKSIARMFQSPCPTFVQHRWHYRFEVLQWMICRSSFLQWLDPASIASSGNGDANPEYSFSDAEIRCLTLLFTDKCVTEFFWSLACAQQLLCKWGHDVSGWLHGCHCHATAEAKERLRKETGSSSCRWSGRRLIEFASSGPEPFLANLRQLFMEQDKPCVKHMTALREAAGSDDQASIIHDGFATGKRLLEGRFLQYTSFLGQPPWNLTSLLEYLLAAPEDMPLAVARSREKARKQLQAYDSNLLGNVGDVGEKFFKTTHRAALQRWARGLDHFMNQQLYRDLVAWSSSLLVMQRLEAKHHLVHAPRRYNK